MFREAITLRVLGEHRSFTLEQTYRDRKQSTIESVHDYAIAMERLGAICLGEATPSMLSRLRKGFCLGLKAQLMGDQR